MHQCLVRKKEIRTLKVGTIHHNLPRFNVAISAAVEDYLLELISSQSFTSQTNSSGASTTFGNITPFCPFHFPHGNSRFCRHPLSNLVFLLFESPLSLPFLSRLKQTPLYRITSFNTISSRLPTMLTRPSFKSTARQRALHA